MILIAKTDVFVKISNILFSNIIYMFETPGNMMHLTEHTVGRDQSGSDPGDCEPLISPFSSYSTASSMDLYADKITNSYMYAIKLSLNIVSVCFRWERSLRRVGV